MTTPETALVFAGVDDRRDAQLPDWYAAQHDPETVHSFAGAVRALPRATATRVAYRNPVTETWVETDRFNALVEPSRLDDQAWGVADTDPLFHIPSDSYAIINPLDVYGPLEGVLRERSHDGTPLGDVVFGEIRQYRGGGEVHMDVMFDGLEVALPGRGDPITVGVTSGYDFFGNNAVYVEGFARDSRCANSIRSLTERAVVKHVGDVAAFDAWWEHLLVQVELVATDLVAVIQEAKAIDLAFTDLPFDVAGFYDLLGLPEYLAERAAADARANAADPFTIDMWTLHSGATHALTHGFRGREGDALDGYVRAANDILFNPEGTIERVKSAYAEAQADTDERGLAGERGVAAIERVRRDLQADVAQFEERAETLRERFEAVSG